KGIGISHSAVLNLLEAFDSIRGLGGKDRCTLWASLNFDVSVYEIWSALLSGAALYIPDEELRFDPDGFINWLAGEKITSAYIPPFMIAPMAATDAPLVLKRMLTGVDPIPEPLLCEIKKKIPGLSLINGYGPAEATVCATLYTVPDIPSRKGKAPIGKAIKNLDVFLADEAGNRVSPGEKGEILISGIQVADGYVNAPERTDKAFVTLDGKWVYKTGDMAYALDDGNLVFTGRKDFQIKHRGVRIEPGEIESHLRAFPGITQAAVVLKPGKNREKALIAYINARIDTDDLLHFLRDRIPRNLLPAVIILLDGLPQTPQGKIDRKALAARTDEKGPESAGSQQKPDAGADVPGLLTEMEKGIAGIWETVLKCEPVKGGDNFLLLGGDSISGARITSRIKETCYKDIRINTLFEYPGFRQFSEQVAKAPDLLPRESAPADSAPKKMGETDLLPLLPDQEFIWLFEQVNAGTSVYHIPLVYDIRGPLDIELLRKAVEAVQGANPALSTRFFLDGNRPCQGPGTADLHFEVQSGQDLGIPSPVDDIGAEIRAWLDTRIAPPFDLENGPVFRTSVLSFDQDRHLVCLVFHHLVFDGWSASVFTRSVSRAYGALAKRDTLPRIDNAPAYKKFISRRLARSEQAWHASRPFYQDYLTKLPQYRDAEGLNFDASVIPVDIPLKKEISELAGQVQASPFAILLAFFQILMFSRDHRTDQVTGIAYANREDLAAEEMIGFFMNTLVVRNTIRSEMTFAETFARVKQTMEKLLRYADSPFRDVSRLSGETGGQSELFTSLFLMQTMDFPFLEIPGTRSGFIDHKPGTTNVDLTLELFETDKGFSGGFKYRTQLFSRDTMASLADKFTRLVRHGTAAPEAALDTIDGMKCFPVSPMQHGMLMETLRAPQGAGCYVEQIVFEMKQAVDIQRFAMAWEKVIRHHEILRLGFNWQGLDQPEQYIDGPGSFNLEFNDWSNLNASEQNEFLEMFLKADRRLGFTLHTPPAFRVALFKRTASRFTCIWSFHHCIGDGRSMTYILRDLFLSYQDPEIRLKPTGSFRQYISWLNHHPRRQSNAFWETYLQGFKAPLVFPFRIRKKGMVPSRRQQHTMPLTTGSHKAFLSSITARKIKKLCRINGLSMNSFLMGAWAILLSHYTGKTDILFGATVSVRNFNRGKKADTDKTGMYINTLPVRIKVDPEQHLTAFISGIRSQWKKIREHDHISLTDIHALSPIKGSIPLSEIYFSYDYKTLDQSVEPYKKHMACANISLLERTPAAIFLTVQGEDELEVSIEYDQRKFNEKTTRQILSHFANFLKTATETPDAVLSDLPVLTDEERTAIDRKLRTSRRHLKPRSCIHNLLEIQATVNKSVPAVTDGQKSLTYDQLNRFANQIAHFLGATGGGPEKRVLFLLPQGTDTISVLLGILKSGGCYIPVDVSYPGARIEYIIKDADPDLIITDSVHADKIPDSSVRLVLLDREMQRILQCADTDPQIPSEPEHTAYIIYTSGTTGNPKGVMIQHSALASFTRSAAETYDIQPTDRVLQFASISFDASAEEIYPTLFSGACLVIKPRDLVLTPEQLLAYCDSNGITVADLPTAYWHVLADQINDLTIPASLRMIIIGGEAANPDKLKTWQQAVNDRIR
ncbi:MAG: condensation domain-containing protein, partial [Desulfobacterales bacterium]|nr:condensation domain-containing protein [Desulfobacterales bacterium]